MAFGAAGRAAEQQSGGSKPAAGGSRSLDQELLEDLDNELLDGTSKKLPPPKTDMPAGKRSGEERGADKEGGEKPSANSPPGDDPDAMGEDIGQGPEDPLTRIGREMRVVERLIAEKKAAEAAADSVKAGQLQDKIVDELAKLIETLEKQQQQQQQSSAASGKKNKQQGLAGRQRVNQPKSAGNGGSQQAGSKNNQPARDSTERLSKNETQRPDMGQMKGLMKDLWGQLPAHAREQMLQTSPEQFLPRYELQLEKYYKRLAEQQKEPH
jgi:hypothetical protein